MNAEKSALQLQTDQYIVNVGPQHPSTHGGAHLQTVLDGEIIVDTVVKLGYVHRSVEKIAESKTFTQFIPYTARLDYLSGCLPPLAYTQAVEKLLNISPTERSEYIRVIMAEFSRISSHLLCIGSLALDLGATTACIYCVRDREQIMDMFEMVGGQRLLLSFLRVGGVSHDLPENFYPAARRFIKELPKMIDEYHAIITGNEILQKRLKGVGRLSAEDALAYGVTGPNLRASGFDYDIRRDDPYGIYDRFKFEVPIDSGGDAWARYLVRVEELIQSARIIEQALDSLPEGDICAKTPRLLKAPENQDIYHHIESSKGELGFYIVGAAGKDKPHRLHVRAPSFINLQVLPMMCKGAKFQDLITNIATLDPVLGEADR
ncbi:MAG: NADH-quinone oxidoreductase subunit D [Syntrophomonadaceae bacterium]|jgi:NADH-quinone oxidoreductase subunit D|nr:NADH-quinone oxidoreductase subunit D [Syntrophomonadaceae bacterium]